MKYVLYTVKDTVAKDSGPVFCAVNDQVAARQFRQLVKDAENRNDFELYSLGSFDTETLELQASPSIYPARIDEVGVAEVVK